MASKSSPYLTWSPESNPVLGKLKLQSMERCNVFFEQWLHFVFYKGGIPDMSKGLFPVHPYTLNKNTEPKKVDVPNETTIINGLYEDTFGKSTKREKGLSYTVKVFVWIETEDDADGVVFDFQKQEEVCETNLQKQ